ncbi:hypothetical protein ACG9X6_04520 [Acinetobacter guillouiae]
MSEVLYTYKTANGKTILTNKKSSSASMTLTDARSLSPNQIHTYGQPPQTQFEVDYKDWIKAGKPRPALLIPEKTSKEFGFTGYIIFSTYSGKGLISSTPYKTEVTYNTYKDCMSEKNLHLLDFKQSPKNSLNPNYVYPKDTKKEYEYKCISEVVFIKKPIFDNKTLKIWENEAQQDQQKEKKQQDKDSKNLELAKKEIESNRNLSKVSLDNTRNENIPNIHQMKNSIESTVTPTPQSNKRRIIILDDGTYMDAIEN